jgi:hypothetical protein
LLWPLPSQPPRSWNGEGEVLGVVPLLRAEGGEKESQFGLVAPEDGRPTMILGTADHSLFTVLGGRWSPTSVSVAPPHWGRVRSTADSSPLLGGGEPGSRSGPPGD